MENNEIREQVLASTKLKIRPSKATVTPDLRPGIISGVAQIGGEEVRLLTKQSSESHTFYD